MHKVVSAGSFKPCGLAREWCRRRFLHLLHKIMQTLLHKHLFTQGLILFVVASTFGGYPTSFGFMDRYANLKTGKTSVSIPDSSGREFPQFGKYIDGDGDVVAYSENCFIRPYRERLADYYHKCVLRKPIRQVSDSDMKRWENRYLRKRDMSRYESGIASKRLKKVRNYGKILVAIAAECYMYGISEDAGPAITAINNLYANDRGYYWDSLCKENPRQWAVDWYNDNIEEVEEYFERKMSILDKIHKKEFSAWLQETKNQKDVFMLKQLAEQRKMKKAVESLRNQVESVEMDNQMLEFEMNMTAEELRKKQRQLEWEQENALRQQQQKQRQLEWEQENALRQQQQMQWQLEREQERIRQQQQIIQQQQWQQQFNKRSY